MCPVTTVVYLMFHTCLSLIDSVVIIIFPTVLLLRPLGALVLGVPGAAIIKLSLLSVKSLLEVLSEYPPPEGFRNDIFICISEIKSWTKKWRLNINCLKTDFICFTKKDTKILMSKLTTLC